MSFFSFMLTAATGQTAASFVAGSALGAALTQLPGIRRMRRADERRTGGQPLPRSAVESSAAEEPALEQVDDFVDRLAALPFAEWCCIGEAGAISGAAQARSDAWQILDATIGASGLRVQAWYVRDALETSAFLASGSVLRSTSAERRAFARARCAAERAALALLAKPHLSADDFAELYAPLAGAMPLSALPRIATPSAAKPA